MKIDAKQTGKVNQQRTYWELEVPNDRNVGILLQHGGDGQLYYDGATGDVLDTNKKTVSSCTSLLAGSIVGINIWYIKADPNYQNLVTFYKDGTIVNELPFSIEGSQLSPIVFVNNEESKDVVNEDHESFKHNPGNV